MASILKTDKIEGVTASGTVQMPAGHVIQTVETTTTGSVTTTSTSIVASGVTVSLTPKFQNSKFIVTLNGGSMDMHTGAGHNIQAHIYRQIASGGYSDVGKIYHQTYGATYGHPQSAMIIDSPNTLSTIYYQPYYLSSNGNGVYFNANSCTFVLQVMEIAQ